MFGNLGQMASLLGRVKEIQAGIKTFKDELPKLEFSGSCGGVTAVVSGDLEVRRLEVAPGTDPAAIANLSRDAVNQALLAAKQAMRAKMQEISGGIDLPGLF